jgi:16S rRNA (adenine1518-N6/adenine1519-N6)-dimethyltransferase
MSTYLWQNFLTDSTIRHRIADRAEDFYTKNNCEYLIEIWPWKWSITKLILDISQKFFLFEKDETLKKPLEEVISKKESWEAKIIRWDVLDWDLGQFDWKKDKTFVVGNLPYYITSPILRKFFWSGKGEFAGWLFMVQDEVWEKLRFDAGKKSYLYWILNYAYEVNYLKTVPAKAFSPAPKVKSCLIWLTKKDKIPNIPFDKLIEFLDLFSPYSRKTLSKISKMLSKKWVSFVIPENLSNKRLEELNWTQLEEIFIA